MGQNMLGYTKKSFYKEQVSYLVSMATVTEALQVVHEP
jgi:hypothetical protein